MMGNSKKMYLTEEGLRKIEKEFADLRRVRMAKIKEEDSEDEIDFIDRRLEELDRVIKSHEIIRFPPKEKRGLIDVGATVVLDAGNHEKELTIVGTLEADPLVGKISNESPVGKALLGKKVGDVVLVHSNAALSYTVKEVRYGLREKVRRA